MEEEQEDNGTPDFLKVSLPPKPEWWEVPSIPLKISDLRVRNRLNALLNTDLVQLLDRKYMTSLDEAIHTNYKRQLYERIRERQKWEFEREKKLVVEGRIPLEDGPPELAQHPMFIVKEEVQRIIDEKRAKKEARRKKQKIPPFNYKLLSHMVSRGHVRSISEVSVLSGATADLDMLQNQRQVAEAKLMEDLEAGVILPDELYSVLKYTPDIIKEMMSADTVEEMYRLANTIFAHDVKLTEAITKIEEKGKMWDELSMAPSMILSNISMVPSAMGPAGSDMSAISLVKGAPTTQSYIPPDTRVRRGLAPQESTMSAWESTLSVAPSTISNAPVESNVSLTQVVMGKDIQVIRKEPEEGKEGEAPPPQDNPAPPQ